MADSVVMTRCPCPAPRPTVQFQGDRKGEPILTREVAWHPEGTILAVPEVRAAEMVRRRLVKLLPSDPATSRLARLALAVCSAPNATEAVAAAVGIARTWHATLDGDSWVPAPAKGLGLTRDGWSAGFPDPETARAHFTEHPESNPLFSFHEGEHFLAFIWRDGGLLPIPTETQKRRV